MHLVERTIFGHASERLEPRHHWSRPWFRFAPAHLRRAEGRAISRNDQRCPRSGPSARADLRVRGQTSAAPPSYLEGVDRGARGRLASGSSVTITTRPIALTFFSGAIPGPLRGVVLGLSCGVVLDGPIRGLSRNIHGPARVLRSALQRWIGPEGRARQRDLADYLELFNYERVHDGRYTKGRIPAELFYGARKMRPR